MQRKIWVKRPGASPTRVEVSEDDLVDNVRDVILLKYANSLGRNIDSPDITLKIVAREQANKNVAPERALGPEESISRTLDAYYPGGQTIEEALIIEVPSRRTPRPSPRAGNHIPYYIPDLYRPDDAARDYFGPVSLQSLQSPHLGHVPSHPIPPQHPQHPQHHAMAVLTSGQLPALPSPGGVHGSSRRHQRPKYMRQHTSSPTIIHTTQTNSNLSEPKSQINGVPPSAALPKSPGPSTIEHTQSITPPNRVPSPHLGQRNRKKKDATRANAAATETPPSQPASASLLDGTVPPINVLIVEDNVINLKLLEAFMKRLKVRWKSAMNGREAVNTWKTGGFHLVLMDIQLPVMNGLDATREIRRLEMVNGIGAFSGSPIDGGQKQAACNGKSEEDDKLPDRSLFKSPVIIVALTASSLQSDRHEALAAGCNDFLTKPVNFMWMERKVTEWGCMQALIDYDGWRKWKEYGKPKENEDPAKKAQEEKDAKAKARAELRAAFARPPPGPNPSAAPKPTPVGTVINSGNGSKDGKAESGSSSVKDTLAGEKNSSREKLQSPTSGIPSTPSVRPPSNIKGTNPPVSSPIPDSAKSALAKSAPPPQPASPTSMGHPLTMTTSTPATTGAGAGGNERIPNGLPKKTGSWGSGTNSSTVNTSSPLAAPPLRSQKSTRSGSASAMLPTLASTIEVDEPSS